MLVSALEISFENFTINLQQLNHVCTPCLINKKNVVSLSDYESLKVNSYVSLFTQFPFTCYYNNESIAETIFPVMTTHRNSVTEPAFV